MNTICSWGLTEWGNIFTIILGLSSIITAYATIRALGIQNKTQKEAVALQQKAQQPIFKIVYELKDFDDDGKYDTNIIHIYNEGNAPLYIKDISLRTLFTLEAHRKIYQFEMIGYYYVRRKEQALTGELFVGYYGCNHDSFCALYDETKQKTQLPDEFYAISHMDLIKIEYVDINQNTNSVYYKNREPITEKSYQDLCSQIINPNEQLDIDKVSLDDMLNYIDSHGRL